MKTKNLRVALRRLALDMTRKADSALSLGNFEEAMALGRAAARVSEAAGAPKPASKPTGTVVNNVEVTGAEGDAFRRMLGRLSDAAYLPAVGTQWARPTDSATFEVRGTTFVDANGAIRVPVWRDVDRYENRGQSDDLPLSWFRDGTVVPVKS